MEVSNVFFPNLLTSYGSHSNHFSLQKSAPGVTHIVMHFSRMAGGKDEAESAQAKRSYDRVASTPGRKSSSPSKKQAKQAQEEQRILNPELSFQCFKINP